MKKLRKKDLLPLLFSILSSLTLHSLFIYALSHFYFQQAPVNHFSTPLKEELRDERAIEKTVELQLVEFKKREAPKEECFLPTKEQVSFPFLQELEISGEQKDSTPSLANPLVEQVLAIIPTCFHESINPYMLDQDRESLVNRIVKPYDVPLSSIPSFSSLRDLTRGVSSDDFDLIVEYSPKRFKPGYVFKVTLTPKKELSFKRMRQHFFFLIDRSTSIPKERYELFKESVMEALPLLHSEDTFNILIFDDKIMRLSSTPLCFNEANKRLAEQFLQKYPHGGLFAATDLYSSLGKIIPQEVSENEINTAILLSDGDTYLNLEKRRVVIGNWSRMNSGKVALFSAATGENNNLPLLELLSHFNRGNLLYIADSNQFESRFLNLIHSLQKPIGKSIHATAVAHEEDTAIFLYPRNQRFPHFYEQRPLTIIGSINNLKDFTLVLQGQYYEKPFRIKKTVSFENGVRGTLSLERQCVQYAAEDYYDLYFQDGKIAHLEEAKNLLSPFNLTPPLR